MREIRDVTLSDYHAPQVLVCPQCGCDFLHQNTVGVYSGRMLPERRMEHQVIVSDTDVVDGYVPYVSGMNPSDYDNGMRVAFMCEGCGDPGFDLVIYQHKGVTHICWSDQHRLPQSDYVTGRKKQALYE